MTKTKGADREYLYSDDSKKYLRIMPGLCNYVLTENENDATLLNNTHGIFKYLILRMAEWKLKTKFRYKRYIEMKFNLLSKVDTMNLNEIK